MWNRKLFDEEIFLSYFLSLQSLSILHFVSAFMSSAPLRYNIELFFNALSSIRDLAFPHFPSGKHNTLKLNPILKNSVKFRLRK